MPIFVAVPSRTVLIRMATSYRMTMFFVASAQCFFSWAFAPALGVDTPVLPAAPFRARLPAFGFESANASLTAFFIL